MLKPKFLEIFLHRLGRNIQVNLILQFAWSIPFFLYTTYSTLYMLKLGISAGEAGFINSVSFLLKAGISLGAGYIINRLGRKKSLIIM